MANNLNWYRVELHTHTIASDGDMTPKDLVDYAVNDRGYDAIVITDHNTTSSIDEAKTYGEKKGLLVIPGIEWTTFWGHIVVTGGKSKVDWREITKENIEEKIKEARDAGDIVTLAHPKRLGTPFGSECRNLFDIKDWQNIDAYEIWSHYDPSLSMEIEETKKEWVSKISSGIKIAPVYGYDWHNRDEFGPSFAYTYIGMSGEISQAKVLNAIKDSRTYTTMGVEVDCKLKVGFQNYEIGASNIPAGNGEITISAKIMKDYAERFDVEIKGVRFYKQGKVFMAKKWEGEKFSMPIQLEQGLVGVVIYGEVDNKECDLAVLSPFYID